MSFKFPPQKLVSTTLNKRSRPFPTLYRVASKTKYLPATKNIEYHIYNVSISFSTDTNDSRDERRVEKYRIVVFILTVFDEAVSI